MERPNTDFDQYPDVMTVREAAALLRRSPASVYGDVRLGRLPHCRVGGGIRFLKAELARYLSQGGLPAADQQPDRGDNARGAAMIPHEQN